MKRRFASDDDQPIAVEGKARRWGRSRRRCPRAANVCYASTSRPPAGSGGDLPFAPSDRHAIAVAGVELVAVIADHDCRRRSSRPEAPDIACGGDADAKRDVRPIGAGCRSRLTTVSMVCSPMTSRTLVLFVRQAPPLDASTIHPFLPLTGARARAGDVGMLHPGKGSHDAGLTCEDWQGGPRGRATVHRSPGQADGQRRTLTSIEGRGK